MRSYLTEIKCKEVKLIIIDLQKRERSAKIDLKVILESIKVMKSKQIIKKVIVIRRLLSKDILLFTLIEEIRLILKRDSNQL